MEYAKNMLRKYICEKCHYSCCKKSSWTQHLSTSKHLKANTELMPANKEYVCEKCNIKFIITKLKLFFWSPDAKNSLCSDN